MFEIMRLINFLKFKFNFGYRKELFVLVYDDKLKNS